MKVYLEEKVDIFASFFCVFFYLKLVGCVRNLVEINMWDFVIFEIEGFGKGKL